MPLCSDCRHYLDGASAYRIGPPLCTHGCYDAVPDVVDGGKPVQIRNSTPLEKCRERNADFGCTDFEPRPSRKPWIAFLVRLGGL